LLVNQADDHFGQTGGNDCHGLCQRTVAAQPTSPAQAASEIRRVSSRQWKDGQLADCPG
jgi:hypothetical protein